MGFCGGGEQNNSELTEIKFPPGLEVELNPIIQNKFIFLMHGPSAHYTASS